MLPKAILNSRILLQHGQQVKQALVQWEGLSVDDATWEDWHTLVSTYPSINLEDRVVFNGGGNVMNCENHVSNKRAPELVTTTGHLANDPTIQEPRRSGRARIANRKYAL